MKSRFFACAIALVSALALTGVSGDVTTSQASPATTGPSSSIALLSGGAAAAPPADLRLDLAQSNLAASRGTLEDLLVFVIEDVDQYWGGVWEESGLAEPFVSYAFPATGEVVSTLCGVSDDMSAWYCSADDQIVVSQTVAARIWEGSIFANLDGNPQYATGDFSVAFVVAHEYAHSLQAELGILQPTVQVYPVYKTELHADCWAGVWASSADDAGLMEPGDLDEAYQTTLDLGDYFVDDPLHHGTPDQRSAAFLTGFENGDADACEGYLVDVY